MLFLWGEMKNDGHDFFLSQREGPFWDVVMSLAGYG